MQAPATTGPARGPRPASSTPAQMGMGMDMGMGMQLSMYMNVSMYVTYHRTVDPSPDISCTRLVMPGSISCMQLAQPSSVQTH